MPPRIVTVTIILFWLTTTGALVYYEVAPRFQAGEPPPFTIPLTAEVSTTSVDWNVLGKDGPIGKGTTRISRGADHAYELSAEFKIDRFKVLFIELEDMKIKSEYGITDEGSLLRSSAHVKLIATKIPLIEIKSVPVEIDFTGVVKDHQFHSQLTGIVFGETKSLELEPIPVSQSGNILNPMHLVHKISGLHTGRSWRIPLMDPMRAIPATMRGLVPDKGQLANELVATVRLEDLSLHGITEACFKIDYTKPEETRPLAATWVRRRDDAVLQQWASYEGIEYTLQRARGQ